MHRGLVGTQARPCSVSGCDPGETSCGPQHSTDLPSRGRPAGFPHGMGEGLPAWERQVPGNAWPACPGPDEEGRAGEGLKWGWAAGDSRFPPPPHHPGSEERAHGKSLCCAFSVVVLHATCSSWRKWLLGPPASFRGDPGVLEWGQLGASLLGLKPQLHPFLAGCTWRTLLKRAPRLVSCSAKCCFVIAKSLLMDQDPRFFV